ncbi:TPA: transporter substrate-binding domain-containing protein [Klebsiella pneumoniae]|nr:transporter substrate-binding domain-containing protein [Klebsiella pneumoniae]
MKKLLIALAGAACLLSSVSAAQADQLQDIEKRGVIRIAVPQDFPPFGSVGTDLQPQGYDIDMARYLAKSMKLKLQLVPVTSANRVPYLQTDKVDLVISSLGKNAEREKVIDFSRAYAPFFLGVFGSKGAELKDSPCFIGLKKNEPALKAKVDTLIEQGIKDGTLNGLSEKWLKAPLPASLGA